MFSPDDKGKSMRKALLLTWAVLSLSACATPNMPAEFKKPPSLGLDYVVGCGDVLFISTWKEEALTRQAVVLPDGNITFPLIGEMKAQGKTISELKALIEKKMAVFMPSPNISVQVIQANSMVVYVLGKVNAPGPYPMPEHLTVMKALTLARGLTPFASKGKISIFRTLNGKELIFNFNYNDVVSGNDLSQNIRLERGDLIIVQ
jgi:polysaccharide export outer membrane protein